MQDPQIHSNIQLQQNQQEEEQQKLNEKQQLQQGKKGQQYEQYPDKTPDTQLPDVLYDSRFSDYISPNKNQENTQQIQQNQLKQIEAQLKKVQISNYYQNINIDYQNPSFSNTSASNFLQNIENKQQLLQQQQQQKQQQFQKQYNNNNNNEDISHQVSVINIDLKNKGQSLPTQIKYMLQQQSFEKYQETNFRDCFQNNNCNNNKNGINFATQPISRRIMSMKSNERYGSMEGSAIQKLLSQQTEAQKSLDIKLNNKHIIQDIESYASLQNLQLFGQIKNQKNNMKKNNNNIMKKAHDIKLFGKKGVFSERRRNHYIKKNQTQSLGGGFNINELGSNQQSQNNIDSYFSQNKSQMQSRQLNNNNSNSGNYNGSHNSSLSQFNYKNHKQIQQKNVQQQKQEEEKIIDGNKQQQDFCAQIIQENNKQICSNQNGNKEKQSTNLPKISRKSQKVLINTQRMQKQYSKKNQPQYIQSTYQSSDIENDFLQSVTKYYQQSQQLQQQQQQQENYNIGDKPNNFQQKQQSQKTTVDQQQQDEDDQQEKQQQQISQVCSYRLEPHLTSAYSVRTNKFKKQQQQKIIMSQQQLQQLSAIQQDSPVQQSINFSINSQISQIDIQNHNKDELLQTEGQLQSQQMNLFISPVKSHRSQKFQSNNQKEIQKILYSQPYNIQGKMQQQQTNYFNPNNTAATNLFNCDSQNQSQQQFYEQKSLQQQQQKQLQKQSLYSVKRANSEDYYLKQLKKKMLQQKRNDIKYEDLYNQFICHQKGELQQFQKLEKVKIKLRKELETNIQLRNLLNECETNDYLFIQKIMKLFMWIVHGVENLNSSNSSNKQKQQQKQQNNFIQNLDLKVNQSVINLILDIFIPVFHDLFQNIDGYSLNQLNVQQSVQKYIDVSHYFLPLSFMVELGGEQGLYIIVDKVLGQCLQFFSFYSQSQHEFYQVSSKQKQQIYQIAVDFIQEKNSLQHILDKINKLYSKEFSDLELYTIKEVACNILSQEPIYIDSQLKLVEKVQKLQNLIVKGKQKSQVNVQRIARELENCQKIVCKDYFQNDEAYLPFVKALIDTLFGEFSYDQFVEIVVPKYVKNIDEEFVNLVGEFLVDNIKIYEMESTALLRNDILTQMEKLKLHLNFNTALQKIKGQNLMVWVQKFKKRLKTLGGFDKNQLQQIDFIGFYINLCVNKFHLTSVYELRSVLVKQNFQSKYFAFLLEIFLKTIAETIEPQSYEFKQIQGFIRAHSCLGFSMDNN